jgi:hypothetical protein
VIRAKAFSLLSRALAVWKLDHIFLYYLSSGVIVHRPPYLRFTLITIKMMISKV